MRRGIERGLRSKRGLEDHKPFRRLYDEPPVHYNSHLLCNIAPDVAFDLPSQELTQIIIQKILKPLLQNARSKGFYFVY